ncbi:MAG: hydroxyacid dehydrogenase [Ruminococcaceae bacterium]|nr:hydroxyacid dehydrogenase [Oscillospiraceae bacterium]
MKLTLLDYKTFGYDLDLDVLKAFGEVEVYDMTEDSMVEERIKDSDIVLLNKVKLTAGNLKSAKNLKLICEFATGYDNIDTEYCKKRNIAVCNVVGYSTNSVAQLTITLALNLMGRMKEYTHYVSDGSYTKSGLHNYLDPVYHQMEGKVWGIVGCGNIGMKVKLIAEALGCKVIVNKRTPVDGMECVDIDTLVEKSDIISIHTPLTDATKNLINKDRILKMKKDTILINVARGLVADEGALADAVKNDKIGGIGIDVFSKEPLSEDNPLYEVRNYPNVILTPHIAWASSEARNLCLEETVKNIKAFLNGESYNRVV